MKQHCCEMMDLQVAFTCDRHSDPHDCPDALVGYRESSDEYGIYIHDGGTSWVTISFCPWCGAGLESAADSASESPGDRGG